MSDDRRPLPPNLTPIEMESVVRYFTILSEWAADAFLKELTAWAESHGDVLALVLVGSYARGDSRFGSDVDVVVIVSEPRRYLDDTTWLSAFNPSREVRVEPYGRVTSLRTVIGGVEVEVSIAPSDWAAAPLDAGTASVMKDGFRFLFDRGGHAAGLARNNNSADTT